MIYNENIGTFPSANADYAGFGPFNPFSFTAIFTAPTPPPAGGDDLNRVRTGILRGDYITDNPSVGGQF